MGDAQAKERARVRSHQRNENCAIGRELSIIEMGLLSIPGSKNPSKFRSIQLTTAVTHKEAEPYPRDDPEQKYCANEE